MHGGAIKALPCIFMQNYVLSDHYPVVDSRVTLYRGQLKVSRKGLKILIAVVIGALLLTGIYKLFNTTIMPTVTSKVTELFNYSGT